MWVSQKKLSTGVLLDRHSKNVTTVEGNARGNILLQESFSLDGIFLITKICQLCFPGNFCNNFYNFQNSLLKSKF